MVSKEKRSHKAIVIGYLIPITEQVDIQVIVLFSLIHELLKFTGLNARWEGLKSCKVWIKSVLYPISAIVV